MICAALVTSGWPAFVIGMIVAIMLEAPVARSRGDRAVARRASLLGLRC